MTLAKKSDAEGGLPRVLCVDDDNQVLEGLEMTLRRLARITTASSAEDALKIIADEEPFALIISDMRMPGMNGAEFLSLTRDRSPTSVRILLTGFTEVDAAISAINDGAIFRFLTKPCSPSNLRNTVRAGLDQNRLVRAEKEILEETVSSVVRALADLLSVADAYLFGQARRVADIAVQVARELEIDDIWALEVAALMAQLGEITLPSDLVARVQSGKPVKGSDLELVHNANQLSRRIVEGVPRLQQVSEIVNEVLAGVVRSDPSPVAILQASQAYDRRCTSGESPTQALRVLRGNATFHDAILGALENIAGTTVELEVVEIPFDEVRVGMRLAANLESNHGGLLLARDSIISESALLRLRGRGEATLPPSVHIFSQVSTRARAS